MCGLAGFVGAGTRSDLERMTAALAHRGPDGSGLYIDDEHPVHLGHRRLAIIDVASGAQPMSNDDGSTVLVFNGEIYNHRALRRELETQGVRFRTDHSDTEVIIRGWDHWGEGVVDRLEGMFAIALYDRRRGRLLLARDRFGEKPLFFARHSGGIAFSSELPSLRLHPAVAGAPINALALQKFFAHSFLPGRITPWSGVERLPPGSALVYDVATNEVTERRYWQFSILPDAPPAGSPEEWAEELALLLRDAVASRLESDVPLGVFLSGGIDSSAVASLAAKAIAPARVQTFSIGFDEPSFDETSYANEVARLIGSDQTVGQCRVSDMLTRAPEVLSRMGEPLGDPSILPTFMLCEQAVRRVKVALSGDGGDELFAGYDPFKALRLARLYSSAVPRPVHRALSLIAARLPPSEANMSFDFKVNRALRGVGHPARLWNPVWLAGLSPDELARVFGSRIDLDEIYSEAIALWDGAKATSDVDRTLEFYTNIYLPDDILVKSDRASMLNSLEVRTPFLSLALADYVRRLPHGVKFRDGTTKWILKRALARLLPDSILNRRKKGFGIPVAKWLREMPAAPQSPISGLDDAPFRDWQMEHRTKSRDHRGALWCRLVLDRTLAC